MRGVRHLDLAKQVTFPRLVSLFKKAAERETFREYRITVRRRGMLDGFLYQDNDGGEQSIGLEEFGEDELIRRLLVDGDKVAVRYWTHSGFEDDWDEVFGTVSLDPSARELVMRHGEHETRLSISRQRKMAAIHPEQKRAQELASRVVHETIGHCLMALRSNPDYRVPEDYRPNVHISLTGKGCSRGGLVSRRGVRSPSPFRSGIRLQLGEFVAPGYRAFPRLFEEYASIANHPEIGSYQPKHWTDTIRVLTAHEVAHAVQYEPTIRRPRQLDYRKPHGSGWQDIYRCFRLSLGMPKKTRKHQDLPDSDLLQFTGTHQSVKQPAP